MPKQTIDFASPMVTMLGEVSNGVRYVQDGYPYGNNGELVLVEATDWHLGTTDLAGGQESEPPESEPIDATLATAGVPEHSHILEDAASLLDVVPAPESVDTTSAETAAITAPPTQEDPVAGQAAKPAGEAASNYAPSEEVLRPLINDIAKNNVISWNEKNPLITGLSQIGHSVVIVFGSEERETVEVAEGRWEYQMTDADLKLLGKGNGKQIKAYSVAANWDRSEEVIKLVDIHKVPKGANGSSRASK